MHKRLEQSSQQQSKYLDELAESELRAQKQRLDAYALQARYALADIYDRADDQQGAAKKPDAPGAGDAAPPVPVPVPESQ
jgi:hypothetical protein